eukprot:TRINITY_DN69418_c0_g1_i2.p2 TRINITY_DN69418_c0_g1~~TRINITY_DN69418_c0_g1_i2.p2  ORF type:complete len:148 (-),score=38.34 TRINITY_DN69418_c0_g1_i2:153-596(-)
MDEGVVCRLSCNECVLLVWQFCFFFFKQKTAYEMQRGLVGSEMCIRDSINAEYMGHESIREIEEILQSGIIEQIILQAHNELKYTKILKEWKPWNFLNNVEQKEQFEKTLAKIREDNMFPYVSEPTKDEKAEPPPRNPTANPGESKD